MSKKDVEDSKHRFIPAKPESKLPRANPTFLDGIKINKKKNSDKPIEFNYMDGAKLTDDSDGAFAKKIEHPSGHTEFFVKFATAGPEVGRMLNPWGFYYKPGDERRIEPQMGRKRYEYRKVNERTFDAYIQFLKTRSQRYILNAERELENG
jgi:hypothetical protein